MLSEIRPIDLQKRGLVASKSELRNLLRWRAIKCVYATKTSKFFLFKDPGKQLRSIIAIIRPGARPVEHIDYNCAVLNGQRIIYSSAKEFMEFFLTMHKKSIDESPEFLISNIKNDDLKIHSPKYLRPIKDLLRSIGFLSEPRGKIKKVDKITKQLKAFLIKEYKTIKQKRPLPMIALQKRLTKEVNEMFPNDPKIAEKYYWSDATIRRTIKTCRKK